MLVTKHFVLLHFPRTGGVFMRQACRNHLPPDWIVHESLTHAGLARLPAEYAQLPKICFIRNPWEWYVSYYEFTRQFWLDRPDQAPTGKGHDWSVFFDQGRNDFRDTVSAMCSPPEGGRRWALAMREWDVDYLTATFSLVTGRVPAETPADSPLRAPLSNGNLEIGRYESLRDDLLGFLDRNEIRAPEEFLETIRMGAPRHQSQRRPYHEYYDDELRDLVGSKAHVIVDEFGYEF